MSLITQFRGDVKSGKTLSAVYWTKRLMVELECPVYTNMVGCRYRGTSWAETIKLNDMLVDMRHADLNEARYKLGILLLDEAHIYWDTNNMRGQAGNLLTAMIAQAGKRGLIVIYTSHLSGMVAKKVRELTQMVIKCRTNNEGHSVLWNVSDTREMREALDEGYAPPPPYLHVLHQGHRQFNWYDTNEVIDPFSFADSLGASPAAKRMMKQIDKLANAENVDDKAIPVEGAAELIALEEATTSRRERTRIPKTAFGGAR